MAHGPWWVVGPSIGLLVVGLLWTLNKPLGALGGWVDVAAWLRAPRTAPSWRVMFLGGVVLGGLVHALATGHLVMGFANAPLAAHLGGSAVGVAVASVAAGGAIGFGARIAGGCTSGHAISGTALGSPASFVACGTFMTVAVGTAHAIAWLTGGV
ncbi:MAG: YeeE/YedE family protein [Deltaproteobacteria bacterium]|nr:YeeE/YedE family protein [Deltaproteobacteria bacterium]